MKAGKDHHLCSGCGRRTYRRIRKFPTLGYEDRRCGRCVDRGVDPTQVKVVDVGRTAATEGRPETEEVSDGPEAVEDQVSLWEDGGS